MGTHQFGGDWGLNFPQDKVNAIMDAAHNEGINLVDTAPCYGPDHLSEKLIGKALGSNRDRWLISTKFGQRYDILKKTEISDFSLNHVKKQLDLSLKYLKTDYIDLYQFHSGTNLDFRNEELWSFLHNQVDKGRIRSLGLSFAHNVVDKNDTFQLEGISDYGLDFVQLVYNRLTRVAENTFIPFCKKNNIGVMSRVPLAKGFLSGKYSAGHDFSPLDHRSKFNKQFNDKLLMKVETIKQTEIPKNVKMSQWALSWCLDNPTVSCVIPGCKSEEQVKLNARAASV